VKAEVGDLIAYSAQSRWSPMKFGIVYGFNKNGNPMVHTEKEHYRSGSFVKKMGKAEASSNYLVLSGANGMDDRIVKAIHWHVSFDK